jgi:hypothetical protein
VRIVYLHGFASSPRSAKARFFSRRFGELGIPVAIPELDRGDFTSSTISGQLEAIEETVADRPAVLMGSSLGGYLAALFASRLPRLVEKLILMAPAFRFPSRLRERYTSEEMDEWRRRGNWPIFHYGANRVAPLSYRFVEDSQGYEDHPDFSQPALIFHGTRDEVVPVEISQQHAAGRPNVKLRLLDSGHELTDVLEEMWRGVRMFLGLGESRPIAQG